MKNLIESGMWFLILLWSGMSINLQSAYAGRTPRSYSYDSSATTQCLEEPWEPTYDGGIIVNPEFHQGTTGWTAYGGGTIGVRKSISGNVFIAASSRKDPMDSFSHKVQLEMANLYAFSAWVQISGGVEKVAVMFKTEENKVVSGGSTIARHGCWSLFKGGIVANSTGTAIILFQCKNTSVEIWVDNVSLQPFTSQQWRSHQDKNIAEIRKSKVRFQIQTTTSNNTEVAGTRLLIKEVKPDFPFGCGINYHILENKEYQNWFKSRFKFATFTNEMKWYSTEKKAGQENYSIADAMLKFTRDNEVSVRGHCIFWDNPRHQPEWVKDLSSEELQKAADKRINSVVSRYAGQLIHWDVVNENLHFRFFEDKLGPDASSNYYYVTKKLDPNVVAFINEYNTIEDSDDEVAAPVNYVKKIEEILSYPGNAGLTIGIGLQGHFGCGRPNLAYMRSSLDILGTTGFPIWLTEVDVGKDPNQTRQAEYLEEILREGYSHPAVQGIIMFAGPAVAGFNVTTLADASFNNTAAGDVVDKLINEWSRDVVTDHITTETEGGSFQASLFHGEYEIEFVHPLTNFRRTTRFKVGKNMSENVVRLQMDS